MTQAALTKLNNSIKHGDIRSTVRLDIVLKIII